MKKASKDLNSHVFNKIQLTGQYRWKRRSGNGGETTYHKTDDKNCVS